jgi:cytochrome c556
MVRRFVRYGLVGAALLLAAVQVGAAAAQQPTGEDAIVARQHLMKKQGAQVKTLIEMIRGKTPYDGAKAVAAFKVLADTSAKIPTLFPEDSKTGHKTHALPAIWQNKADFDAKAHKLHDNARAAEATAGNGLAALKTAFATVGDDCDACHDKYRRPEN